LYYAPTRRPRAHHRVNPYPGVCRQNETEMFSDHDETSPSIVAVSDIRNTIPSPADGGQIFSWCECAEKWKKINRQGIDDRRLLADLDLDL